MGKKIKGHTRHILTDIGGPPVAAQLHAAKFQDRDSAPALVRSLPSIRHAFPWLRRVVADNTHASPKLEVVLKRVGQWSLESVKRPDATRGFEGLPHLWVVERTLAWLNRSQRLAKDFEATIAAAQAWPRNGSTPHYKAGKIVENSNLLWTRLLGAITPAIEAIRNPAIVRRDGPPTAYTA